MRTRLIAILLVVSSMIALPAASALTPRSNFDDSHCTFICIGGPKVCGDKLCKSGEWQRFMTKLMDNQIRKVVNVAVQLPRLLTNAVTSISTKATSTNISDTSNGKITGAFTYYIGDDKYSTFLPVSYRGNLGITHIIISQTNSGVSITDAWINPQWHAKVTPKTVTFDSYQASLLPDKALGVVIITDGKPAFSLGTLSSQAVY